MKEDAKKEYYTKQILKNLKGTIVIKAGGGKTSWLRVVIRLSSLVECLMDPLIAVNFYEFTKKNFKM